MAGKIISIFIQNAKSDEVLSWLVNSFYNFFPDPAGGHVSVNRVHTFYFCNYRIEGSTIIVRAYSEKSSTGFSGSAAMEALGLSSVERSEEREVARIQVKDKHIIHTTVNFLITESIARSWLKAIASAVYDNWLNDARVEFGEHWVKLPADKNNSTNESVAGAEVHNEHPTEKKAEIIIPVEPASRSVDEWCKYRFECISTNSKKPTYEYMAEKTGFSLSQIKRYYYDYQNAQDNQDDTK